jgi:hypothetical protein
MCSLSVKMFGNVKIEMLYSKNPRGIMAALEVQYEPLQIAGVKLAGFKHAHSCFPFYAGLEQAVPYSP